MVSGRKTDWTLGIGSEVPSPHSIVRKFLALFTGLKVLVYEINVIS
jgi:hypothetical protein